jgi:hypothetical protein
MGCRGGPTPTTCTSRPLVARRSLARLAAPCYDFAVSDRHNSTSLLLFRILTSEFCLLTHFSPYLFLNSGHSFFSRRNAASSSQSRNGLVLRSIPMLELGRTP